MLGKPGMFLFSGYDYFGRMGLSESSIIYLCTPSVAHLVLYDQNNNDNLFDILYNYLLNGRNANKTSECLYMHRNTLNKKLRKIRSIMPIDIEDPNNLFILLFSCITIHYYIHVLGKTIPATIESNGGLFAMNLFDDEL